jgi:hypothetical protein
MPRDGATIFSDLIGKLDVLRVSCNKCERDGCYGLNRLISQRGRDAKLIDWLDELTVECPKKIARNMNDPCGARCARIWRWCFSARWTLLMFVYSHYVIEHEQADR